MNQGAEMKTKERVGKRGSVLVEAVLVMPLFLLLLFGIFEFGRILMIKQVITNAAREAARAAAINLDDAQALASARTVSDDYLTRSGVDLHQVTVAPSFSEVNGTDAIQVIIHYNYSSSLYHWVPGIPQTIGLSSQVVMRREA